MAELQGDGGRLVPTSGAGRVRHLLPFEAQLCEQLGITAEEYLYFEQLSQAYNGKRPEGYELIPDVRNDPVSVIVSLVIGVALTAASSLLAPKPKAPQQQQSAKEQAPRLETPGVTGASRFTSNSGFDSVQQLAVLGETIPVVFANKSGTTGGIRVNGILLWSQLLSELISQELQVLLLVSAGTLAARPDFIGLAIGDQTLKNYTNSKLALYYRSNGGRVVTNNRYPEGSLPNGPNDVFSVYSDASRSFQPWFCGTRSPSTQTEFGCYNPMVNSTPYCVQYELVLIPRADGTDGKLRDDAFYKNVKVQREYTTRAGLTKKTSTTLTYTIQGSAEDARGYAPWGLSDVNAATEDRRIVADSEINLNGLYMAGGAVVACIGISNANPWVLGGSKTFTLRIQESGYCQTFANPSAYGPGTGINSKAQNRPWGSVLQRVALATIANNRACDVTEIGLKSTVWKRINGFPNVNSQPDAGTISYYESKNGSISLGAVTRYIRRISFFHLQVRPLGASSSAWTTLEDGRLFAVENNTPSPRYNYLRITHARGQYEFRLKPVPGSEIYRLWRNKTVYFLGGRTRQTFSKSGMQVSFNGYLKVLDEYTTTNPDWTVGPPAPKPTGKITALGPLNNSAATGRTKPLTTQSECRYDAGSATNYGGRNGWIEWKNNASGYNANSHTQFWDGNAVGGAGGSDGGTNQGYNRGAERQTYKERLNGSRYESTIWVGYEICRTAQVPANPISTTTYTLKGGSGTGGKVTVTRWSNNYQEYSLAAAGKGYKSGEKVTVTASGYTHTFTVTTDGGNYINASLNPYDAIIDIYKFDAEDSSHMQGPEHSVVYVNEQLKQDSPGPLYDNLALVGLRMSSSKEWSSFSQLSAYVQKGVIVERLITDAGAPTTTLKAPTNNFAEIAYAILTNKDWGAGEFVGKQAVDRDRMTLAARYCRANGFTWDGVLGSSVNLRDFIYQNAGYALLDFTILGGRFSLAPTCTYDPKTFKISPTRAVDIKALFTDGNIRDLKVTWLSPEERRLFKAVVKYRQEKLNGFPEERLLSIRLNDNQGGSDIDPEENFDLSGFCTRRDHAVKFAKMALRLRQLVDHSVSFQTTPASALNLAPGQHFRLVSECTHTSRFANGVITADGLIVSAEPIADGTYNVIYWKPGTTGVLQSRMTVKSGICQTVSLRGTVYTLATSTTSSRVYKVETMAMGEEGFVEITASHEPVSASLAMATLDWDDRDFIIEES